MSGDVPWHLRPDNIERARRAQKYEIGQRIIWHKGMWVLPISPDEPGCTTGQFPCKTPQVCTYLGSVRNGMFEYVRLTVVDTGGMPRVGYLARWNVQPMSANIEDLTGPSYDIEER